VSPPTRSKFHFFALRRSGHHAIINWVIWSMPGLVAFRNDRIVRENQVIKPGRVQVFRGPKQADIKGRLAGPVWRVFPASKRVENSEDADDLSVANAQTTVLILRDFYNNMASRLKWERDIRSKFRDGDRQDTETLQQMLHAKDLWSKYARLALEQHGPANRCCLYDKWVSQPAYREGLARQLDVPGHPGAIKETATYGPGSSFEGMTGTPEAEKLIRRYEQFGEDPLFIDLCRDKEILSLNRSLFGDTPSAHWASGL
jgi:hypothetical protein